LIPATTPATHISDFRQQPRATHENLQMADDVTTVIATTTTTTVTMPTAAPPSYPRQYVELLTNLFGTVRDRYRYVIDNILQPGDTDRRPVQPLIMSTNEQPVIDDGSQAKETIDFRYFQRLMDDHLAALMANGGGKLDETDGQRRVLPRLATNLRRLRKNGEYIVMHALSPDPDDRDRLRVLALYTFAPVLGTVRTISRMNRQLLGDQPITRLFPVANEHDRAQRRVAFQNAFIKYASLVANSTTDHNTNNNDNNHHQKVDDKGNNANVDRSLEIASKNSDDNDADDDDDDDDADIEKLVENDGKFNRATRNDYNDDDGDDAAKAMEMTTYATDTKVPFGVVLLEYLGQLVGLTWGALSQLPTLFSYYNNRDGSNGSGM
jgi:hypothetical protein